MKKSLAGPVLLMVVGAAVLLALDNQQAAKGYLYGARQLAKSVTQASSERPAPGEEPASVPRPVVAAPARRTPAVAATRPARTLPAPATRPATRP